MRRLNKRLIIASVISFYLVILGILIFVWTQEGSKYQQIIFFDPPNPNAFPFEISEKPTISVNIEGEFHIPSQNRNNKYRSLSLLIGTYHQTPRLISGKIHFDGECEFSVSDQLVYDNQLLVFPATSDCLLSKNQYRTTVEFIFEKPTRIAFWTWKQPINIGESLYFSLTNDESNKYLLRGGVELDLDPMIECCSSRIHRLLFMWKLDQHKNLVFIALIILAITPILALFFIYIKKSNIGIFCLSLAAGIAFSFFVPPLQSPDEPDHFISYLKLTGNNKKINELKYEARRLHFERIKFRTFEKFSHADLFEEYHKSWSKHVKDSKIQDRSTLSSILWKNIGKLIDRFEIIHQLLILRLFHALVFSLALTIIFYLYHIKGEEFPFLPLFILFFPYICFIAIHFSDYALLTSTYIIWSGIFIRALEKGWHSKKESIFIGILLAITFLQSRSAIVFYSLIFLFFVINSLSIQRDFFNKLTSRQFLKHRGIFWLILLMFFQTVFLLLAEDKTRAALPIHINFSYKQAVACFVIALVILAYGLEYSVFSCRNNIIRLNHLCKKKLAFTIGLWIVFSYLANLFDVSPLLQDIETNTVSLKRYLLQLTKVVLIFFRFQNFDFFVQISFFGGFGWLDTQAHTFYYFISISLIALGFFRLPFQLSKLSARLDQVQGVLLFVGIYFTLFLYGCAAHMVRYNLHGRYLIGLYICILAICAYSLSQPLGKSIIVEELKKVGFIMLMLASQVYILTLFAIRYF